mgnify:CR=1 FL=1
MSMKKIMSAAIAGVLSVCALSGCTSSNTATETTTAAGAQADTSANAETDTKTASSDFDLSKEINVCSREDGSGTRGAFIELFGVEQKNDAGEKVDYTTDDAAITQSTGVMMTTVSQDEYAIGYISLGSLDNSVKSVDIDGVEATVENIKSGDYKIARPFNIATKDDISDVAKDFITFIMSADGQAVIADNGYISSEGEAYESTKQSGKITVAGSSSVTPVMEKLKEAYEAINPDVTVEINQSDSTTGMNSAMEGICDIGMASRELKDSELAGGLTPTVIAMDGITVIVSNDNPVENLTSEQVKNVYTGDITTWDSLIG